MKKRMYRIIIELTIGVLILVLIILGGFLSYRRIEQRHVQSQINQVIENGGMSEVREIELGGIKQYIAIEGTRGDNPLCLMLHGGPGLAVPYGVSARGQNQELITHCTLVYWDQRGAGKSYDETLEDPFVTLDQLLLDAKELTNYLLEEFNQNKIYVIGFSWGTVLGMKLVETIPQQIEAYFGIGQVVHPTQSNFELYEWLVNEYTRIGATEMVHALRQIGYPPYQKQINQELFTKAIMNSGAYIKKQDGVEGLKITDWILQAFSSPDLTLKEVYETLLLAPNRLLESNILWNQLNQVKFDETLLEVKIPVYFISGIDDYICSKDLLTQWFNQLVAPQKELLILTHSAHYVSSSDESELTLFIKRIINEVYPKQETMNETEQNQNLITDFLN